MTPKKFYFLAGLPRSGGTLITSILNQNPNIFVTPISPLLTAMGHVYNSFFEPTNLDYPRNSDISNMIDALPEAFYKNHSQGVVVDKNFGWLEELPYQILEHHIKNEIKIICPVRPIVEVLASFNKLSDRQKNQDHDSMVQAKILDDIPLPDRRAKYIMEHENSDIMGFINGVKRLSNEGKLYTLHFVRYSELISDTENTINSIYDFLGEPRFEHTYDEIAQPFKFNDAFGYSDLHIVAPTIENRSDRPEDIFTSETIERYSKLDTWANS